jgi:hypothetical protein
VDLGDPYSGVDIHFWWSDSGIDPS